MVLITLTTVRTHYRIRYLSLPVEAIITQHMQGGVAISNEYEAPLEVV
jgi:hypothetical protein